MEVRKMKILKMALVVALFTFAVTSVGWCLVITQPKSGQIFRPGDNVVVNIAPQSTEKIENLTFIATKMNKGVPYLQQPIPYSYEFTIDRDFVGTETILVVAKLSDGRVIQSQVQINVVLPSNIVLTGISVDPTFILLQKMPTGSDPNKIRAYETRDIGVGGLYSDGVERYVASSTDGTTYMSSNEKVVTVDTEGNVTAQGTGTAKITVKNGKFTATVDVVVKPYKP